MNKRHRIICCIIAVMSLLAFAHDLAAQESPTVEAGADLASRYVWRGLDIAATPSIQPTLALGYSGFELGIWGAYTLSNEASENDEIDFWLGYEHTLPNSMTIAAVVTDYYFPNKGIGFFNFNDYDAVIQDTIPDYGAHTFEIGLSLTGPEKFPITLSGYYNVYNDEGNNAYFQLDYPVTVGLTSLNFFVGATPGSEENPGYYGTDDFEVINIGVAAEKEIKITDDFSLPLSVSFMLNPEAEISYMVLTLSL